MRRSPAGGLPIFWQTLLLLIAAVLVAQMMGLLALLLAPPPRPDVYRMSDIAAALSGRPAPPRRRDHDARSGDRDDRDQALIVLRAGTAPEPRANMVSDAGLVRALAERLGRPAGDVRLFFEREGERSLLVHRWRRPYSMRDGEALFFTGLVTAARDRGGWTVAETPAPPLIAPWQRRMILWFALAAVVLAPFAWMFARALTRPIRRFADAADRLGADPQAPAVLEEGPAELRVTARALNRMQARLGDYVGERTAMIGAIAHDLRTPLARIAFRIEAAPDDVREKVLGDVEQMRAMLSATIGFVRNTEGAGARVPVDLAALAGAMAEQERDLGRDVGHGGMVPVQVSADPIAIERLIQNLVDNGIAYAGAVVLSVDRTVDRALLRVADRGPGMAEDLLLRAFQPFVRGDPSRNRATGGIGLGLTIARTIAENHGGTLALENRDGGGLVATLALPLA